MVFEELPLEGLSDWFLNDLPMKVKQYLDVFRVNVPQNSAIKVHALFHRKMKAPAKI